MNYEFNGEWLIFLWFRFAYCFIALLFRDAMIDC